jgi:hypothetical protein
MPVRELVIVRKWGWCSGWLGIPYPCRKTVEEWRWCYAFSHARHRCFGFVQQFQACEDEIEYHYTTGCFGWWHSWHLINSQFTKCFADRLEEQGECSPWGDFPDPGDLAE